MNQDIKRLINSEGFTKAIENKTMFFTPEGKKKLGIENPLQSTKLKHELVAQR